MRFSASAIAALALSLELGAALAQGAGMQMPTDAQIRDAIKMQRPSPSAASGASTGPGLQMPSDAAIRDAMKSRGQGLKESGVVATPGVPSRVAPVAPGTYKANVPAIPAAADGAKHENLDDLVKRYNAGVNGELPAELSRKGDVAVFVSFSMPASVLTELSRQAKEAGAVVVVRGLKDKSIDKTRIAAAEVNKAGAEWEIHPELFKSFKVTKVPTFVVANAKSGSLDEEGCAPEATYASVSGDISIELALDTIRRRASPNIGNLAGLRLDEMHKRNAAPALH